MGHVFISYVEEDSHVAHEVATLLTDAGHTTWRYEYDSRPGKNYLLQTREQIEQCNAFLVVLSPHSLLSNQVELEIIRAHECGKPILPVLTNLTYQSFGQQRPDWQQAMGGATAISLPSGGVAGVGDRLLDGVADLVGSAGNRDRALRKLRTRKWHPKRVLRAAILPVVLLIALIVGVKLYQSSQTSQRLTQAMTHYSDAKKQFDNQQDAEALKNLDRAIELRADFWDAYLLRAELHLYASKPELALADVDTVLASEKNHGHAVWLRGWALRDLNRLEEAVAELERYSAEELGNRDVELDRADLNMRLERWDAADRDFTISIAKYKDRPQGYVGRAFNLIAQAVQRDGEAVTDFHQSLSPESLAELHLAIQDCDYVIQQIDSSFMPAYAARGLAQMIEGWVNNGGDDITRALQSNMLTPDLRERLNSALALANTMPIVRAFEAEPSVDTTWNGMIGVTVSMSFEIEGAQNQQCAVELVLADQSGRTIPGTDEAFMSLDGYLGAYGQFTTSHRSERLEKVGLFVPYSLMPCVNGQNYMQYYAVVLCGRARVSDLVKGPLLFRFPPPGNQTNPHEMFDQTTGGQR